MKQAYVYKRFDVHEYPWPPIQQPKEFTSLLLTLKKRHQTFTDTDIVTETLHMSHVDDIIAAASEPSTKRLEVDHHKNIKRALHTSTLTRNVEDIFNTTTDPSLILVEGAPGIGKSYLINHIAYCWAKGIVLNNCTLVILIRLSDPVFQHVTCLQEIIQTYFRDLTDILVCCDYMLKNNGKHLAFLIDCYDEFPDILRENSFISDIINHKVFPKCTVVVSSRPHAFLTLRYKATIQVNVLGLTEEDRDHFIKDHLQNRPDLLSKLMIYLKSHWIVNSLCFTPFHLTVLIFLFINGLVFPKNLTELYQNFILATLNRYFKKLGMKIYHVQTIGDLPRLELDCINQLSKLSFNGLINNHLTFTSKEVNSILESVPGNMNGFGLLQAVYKFSVTTMQGYTIFRFIHSSIQEYLAAYHISTLSNDQQLSVLENYFWSEALCNMFLFYVAITKGKSLKQYIRGTLGLITIKDKFLHDPLKCCHLYQCFYEVEDHAMCIKLEAVFSENKALNLSGIPLSHNDLSAIIVMITCSSIKHWTHIDLSSCHIEDHGARLLHRSLKYSGVIIEQLSMHGNDLTEECRSDIEEILSLNKGKVLLNSEP